MKIIEIVNFSKGISGTWTRALEDALAFKEKGHDVSIFSSNETEDGEKIEYDETISGVKIKRFPIKKRKGYALWFDFEDAALKLKPDVIIAHGLRKPYLSTVLKISKQIKCKTFCITHAPFIDKELRDSNLNFFIWLYDKFFGKKIMNSFDKIIPICKWEIEILLNLGCNPDKIEYIPNSLSEYFFTQEKGLEQKKILFMGRMNYIKEIEVLMQAFNEANLENYTLEIVSSNKGEYFESLQKYKTEKIIFSNPVYNLEKKIEKIDSCEIYVLPSRKESLPFGLIEAMSRGKIVISTKTKGGEELIQDGENGYLFEIGDIQELSTLLKIVTKSEKKIKEELSSNAKNSSEEFRLKNNFKKWEKLFKNDTH